MMEETLTVVGPSEDAIDENSPGETSTTGKIMVEGVEVTQTKIETKSTDSNAENIADDIPAVMNLREWCPFSNLLEKIPQKAQKGLTTLDLNLTCIAATTEFLALGTNVGLIYWYSRKNDTLQRLKVENNNSSITTLSLVSSVDFMLAAGNQDGIIAIFQIPKIPEQCDNNIMLDNGLDVTPKPVQRYMVYDLHKCQISALEWSSNGMKLFSGDASGNIVLTEMDYCMGISKSIHLLDEKKEIVQLSYAHMNLLISSVFRTIVYSLASKQSHKVGTQDRKSSGNFGAIFEFGLWNKNQKLFASRPGARLWVASLNGTVECTANFKELIGNSHPYIPVINPSPLKKRPREIQLGILFHFMGKYLVTYHKDILYAIDPSNMGIIGSCQELRKIVNLAVNQNEIFVLESSRNIVRISNEPDELMHQILSSDNYQNRKGSGGLPDLMSASMMGDFKLPQEPFTYLTAKLKETSRAIPRLNTQLMNTLKNVIEADMNIVDGQLTIVPPVIPLKHPGIPDITIEHSPSHTSENDDDISPSTEALSSLILTPEESRFDTVSSMPYEDVVAAQFRPEKRRPNKNKKKKKISNLTKKINLSEISDNLSVSSFYSSNSEGDSSSNVLLTNSVSGSSTIFTTFQDEYLSSPATRKSSTDSSNSNISFNRTEQPSKRGSMSSSYNFNDDSNHEDQEDFDSVKTIQYHPIPTTLTANSKFFPDVSHDDVEIKEEILARRLNWPELLPDPSKGLEDFKDDDDEKVQFLGNPNFSHRRSSSQTSSSNRETPETLKDDSITTTIANEEKNYYCEDSTSIDSKSEFENNNPLECSLDIYTVYGTRKKSDSINFSFGPPSGSSNVNSLNTGDENSNSEYKMDIASQLESYTEETVEESTSSKLPVMQDMKVEAVVGNDSWLQYKLPCTISSIAICEKYVICTDCRNVVYYSGLGELSLTWIKMDYNACRVAISPCGSIVWRIYKNILYSLTSPSAAKEMLWIKIAENVSTISLQRKTVGWIIQKDGTLHVWTQAHKDNTLVPEFQHVFTPCTISQIATQANSLVALTTEGKVLARRGITEGFPVGLGWVEVKFSLPSICSIAVGPYDSLWICDVHNNLYFVKDVKNEEKSLDDEVTPWKISISEYIFHNVSQGGSGKNQISNWKSILSDPFKLLNSKTLPLLCGSNSSVWFTCSGSNTMYVNKTGVTGHSWQNVNIESSIKKKTWSNVFAGSIYHQHGFLWLLDPQGKLCYCSPNGGRLQAMDTPSSDPIVSLAPAPEALWVLTSRGHVYARCNITATNVTGHGWDRIQMEPIDGVHLVHISCGSDIAWACDNRGNIFMRIGSLQPPGTTDISPAWVQVDGSTNTSQSSIFTKVYVGNTGHMVWALDNCKNIYVREAIFPELPIGTRWILVSGIEAIRLTISDNAVWALTPKGEIFRRYEISKTNFVGEYWRKVPGVATVLTASLCDEIWVLDASGAVLKHSQEKLKLKSFEDSSSLKQKKTVDDEDLEEWEFLSYN